MSNRLDRVENALAELIELSHDTLAQTVKETNK